MRTAIHDLNNTEGRYLAINPAWDGAQGEHPTDRYLVYVKGAFDIGYMPLTIMDDRQARIEELLDADVPVLDVLPPTPDQIAYFLEFVLLPFCKKVTPKNFNKVESEC